MLHILSSVALIAALAAAQDAPAAAPQGQAPALPQANSDEARRYVETALDKLEAFGRGRFSTVEGQDQAMLRNAGLPFGPEDVAVDGGWLRDMVWADADGREYVRANGRMLAKVSGEWRLRRDKLAGGLPAPFTFEPGYLLATLARLPAQTKGVVHVEAGKLKGRACAIMTWKLEGDDALELADSGALPDVGGGFGGVKIMGAMGGLGMEPPRPDYETYLAFFVDVESGDLLRFAAKSFQTDQMMGGVAIQIGAVGGGGLEIEEEEEEEEEVDEGPVTWRRGFPRIKPKKDQSVLTFRVDFKDLGLAEPPSLPADVKSLLRAR